MSNYTTLYFDADHTLLDFNKTEQKALQNTFLYYKYPLTPQILDRYLQINHELWSAYEDGQLTREEVLYTRFKQLFSEFQINDDGKAFQDFYQNELGKGHELVEHALEVIQFLSQHYDLYIASNGVVATQYRRLHESGLDTYFKDIFISEELGYQKPNKNYFLECFKRTKESDPSKILMIGDSLASDIQGGINANIATCWFNPTHKTNTKSIHPTFEIHSLNELYTLLKKERNYD